jgi:hypothetical protein
MKHFLIAILLLCGCVADDRAAEAPVAEAPVAETKRTTECGATEEELALELELGAASAAGCPAGSRARCNPSGICRCCWRTFPETCCQQWEPYIWCNPSGLCRCSAVP